MMICVAGPNKSGKTQKAIEIARESATDKRILLLDLEDGNPDLFSTDKFRVIQYNLDFDENLSEAFFHELKRTDVLIVDGILEVVRKMPRPRDIPNLPARARALHNFLKQLQDWGKLVIVTYPQYTGEIPRILGHFFKEVIYTVKPELDMGMTMAPDLPLDTVEYQKAQEVLQIRASQGEPIRCVFCGYKNEPDDKKCEHCGAIT